MYSSRLSAVMAALVVSWLSCLGPLRAAHVTVGGSFSLTTTDGVTVTDQTYRDKWLLVYFGYTSCPDSCPTALLAISTALKTLGDDASRLQPVFVTIDPQRDTPRILSDYLQSFDPRIVGLTGTPQQIDAVTSAYGAYAVRRQSGPAAQDYAFDHSVYIYLMGPNGTFLRAFDTTSSADEIASGIRDAMAAAGRQTSRKQTAATR